MTKSQLINFNIFEGPFTKDDGELLIDWNLGFQKEWSYKSIKLIDQAYPDNCFGTGYLVNDHRIRGNIKISH